MQTSSIRHTSPTVTTSGAINVDATTASQVQQPGALIVDGGVGIPGALLLVEL